MSAVFEILNKIDVGEKIEKKGNLSYLSWAFAWSELKKLYPKANYTVYENANGMNYHNDGRTAWVKVGVTVEEMEHIEYLPIMDFKNKSITLDKVTSMDVNKAIQRALTKAISRHGLGLYIYAGEDLPEVEVVPEIKISDEQVVELEGLIVEHERDRGKFLEYMHLKDLGDLNLCNYEKVKSLITAPKK
jgi:hypothetical protein